MNIIDQAFNGIISRTGHQQYPGAQRGDLQDQLQEGVSEPKLLNGLYREVQIGDRRVLM